MERCTICKREFRNEWGLRVHTTLMHSKAAGLGKGRGPYKPRAAQAQNRPNTDSEYGIRTTAELIAARRAVDSELASRVLAGRIPGQ